MKFSLAVLFLSLAGFFGTIMATSATINFWILYISNVPTDVFDICWIMITVGGGGLFGSIIGLAFCYIYNQKGERTVKEHRVLTYPYLK